MGRAQQQRSSARPFLWGWPFHLPPSGKHRRGTQRGSRPGGETACTVGSRAPRRLLRVGGAIDRTLRLRGRQSAVHPLPDFCRRRAETGAQTVRRVRCHVFGSDGVLGTVLGGDRESAPTRRSNGVRRAGIDWPCTPRSAADRLSGRELRRRAHRPDSGEAVSASLRGLLAVVRRRVRRVEPGHPLCADGAIQGRRYPSPCRGACAGRRVARLVEPPAAALSAQGFPACNLPGRGQEARHVAPRHRRVSRHWLRKRCQRVLPPAPLGSQTLAYPCRIPPSNGTQRSGAAAPSAHSAYDQRLASFRRADVAAVHPEKRRCASNRLALPRLAAGAEGAADLQVPQPQSVVLRARRSRTGILPDVHVGHRTQFGSERGCRDLHQCSARGASPQWPRWRRTA